MSAPEKKRFGEKGYEIMANETYRTPEWVTRRLMPHITVNGPIWEPFCGEMDMVKPLRQFDELIFTSDIRNVGSDWDGLDFVGSLEWPREIGKRIPQPFAVISNPAFSVAQEAIERALALTEAPRGIVAMLHLHEFDTAMTKRGHLFRHPAYQHKIILGKRISWIGMELNNKVGSKNFGKKVGPRQLHAWYIWNWRSPTPGISTNIFPAENINDGD